jgi:hypothetical protein
LKKYPLIDHLLRIKEKSKFLQHLSSLLKLEAIYLRSIELDLKTLNPLDVFYSELCSKITTVDRNSPVFDLIYASFENTQYQQHKA